MSYTHEEYYESGFADGVAKQFGVTNENDFDASKKSYFDGRKDGLDTGFTSGYARGYEGGVHDQKNDTTALHPEGLDYARFPADLPAPDRDNYAGGWGDGHTTGYISGYEEGSGDGFRDGYKVGEHSIGPQMAGPQATKVTLVPHPVAIVAVLIIGAIGWAIYKTRDDK